jgi:hypothetical protein
MRTEKKSFGRWLFTMLGRRTELIRPSQPDLLAVMRRMAPAAPNPYPPSRCYRADRKTATTGKRQ